MTPKTISKPDIAATDGGRTTFFTPYTSGIYRFFGTSAAAPHAAAIAALELDAFPRCQSPGSRTRADDDGPAVGALGPTRSAAASPTLRPPSAPSCRS